MRCGIEANTHGTEKKNRDVYADLIGYTGGLGRLEIESKRDN